MAISSVNDAPVNTVPGAQTVRADSVLVFSTAHANLVTTNDVDANGNAEQVTLSVTNGSLTLVGTSGLTFSVGDGTSDASMTFTGTLASIRAALDGMSFSPPANQAGAVTLQITTDDLGNSGSGGPLSTSNSVTINVAGFVVTPTSGLTTTEGGGTATFTVVLTSQPTANVTIALASSNSAEGAESPSSLVFTSSNWNVAQTVTVTGVNDFVQDGNVAYSIVTGAATSGDANYNNLNPSDVLLTNQDNDTASIVVSPTSGLTTTEAGGTATFTVVLTSQPTANVSLNLSSSNTAEGTLSTSTLTFTSANWSVAQTVTVTGVNDFVQDGNIAYSVVTSAATSADGNYNGLNPSDVSLTNLDNDTAGITVSPTSGLITTEAGGTATFDVVLNSQPTANVTISIASSNTAEGTVSASSLTFTSSNWNVVQTVTVTGVNDFVQDGNIAYSINTGAATSGDANYNGLNASDVAVTNQDNDSAGIVVSPTSGLTTPEAGGTAAFTVVLTSQPTADVTISLGSSNTAEGTVSAGTLTFTSTNWNVAQTVTITGVDDFVQDGNTGYTIVTAAAASADANYNGRNPSDVTVTNQDNDTASIVVSPTSGLTTTEAGGTTTFTIVLTSQPTANVVLNLASSNTAEGTPSVNSVTFTSANWNAAQTIIVTGVDDFVQDGNIAYSIVTASATSADANYNGLNPSDVSLTNLDNDTAGFVVSPTSGLTTTEAGGTATLTVVLTSQPTANVSLNLSSTNTAEGTLSTSTLTFTSANWSVAQTVTVTGVNDFVQDGNIAYSVVTSAATSADGNYNGLNPSDVSLTNLDNDTAGITVSPTSGLITTEAGGTATFDVVLNSQPTANVTISIASSNTAEGTVSASSLTFTSANWNVAQTVTLTGVDDVMQDGNTAYSIITGAASSADANYSGINPSDVGALNLDDDTAGITVTPTAGLTTTEGGGTATFMVVLNTAPTADVTIGLASSNSAEGTLSAAPLIFTSSNWSVAQVVTVTGVDDVVEDGDIAFVVVTAAATSADNNYNGLNPSDVAVTNLDDDVAAILISPTSGLTTTEASGSTTFSVVLATAPTADVTIGLASSNTAEGTIGIALIMFTSGNWNIPQLVTVTGVDDSVQDGNVAYSIITAPATSGDANYAGLNASDVALTNLDNDTAGIVVSPTSGLTTTEAGGTATFTVVLTSQPTATVSISLASSNTAEATQSPSSLTFTTGNWNVAQTVTVTGVDDFVQDGNIAYFVVTGAATSADGNYNGLNPSDVALTNLDNDTAGIVVSPTSGLTTTEAGGTATFTVLLTSQPTANVSINLASSNAAEGTISAGTLTFTTSNWSVAQTVTVTGVNDFVQDGNIAYAVVTSAATSADNHYNNLNPSDVALTNLDDDAAGITVSPTSGLVTTEAGATATFNVVLASQPTANVTVGIVSSNTAEGTVNVSSLTFTSANWNLAQTVTLTGVDDFVQDGNVAYTIQTAAASSADLNYNGLNASDVTVTNQDNDSAAIVVSPTGGLTTTETGGTATFNVVLTSQPTANVSLTLASSNTAEGTLSASSLTFTSGNWNVAQTVTVTGVDDSVQDGNIGYTVITGSATSGDSNYNGLNPSDVTLANLDDDTAGITVTPTSGLTTTEAGGSATFTVVLNSQPTANVTLTLSSSNSAEATESPSSLVFTSANWNVAQTVTVTGVDDFVQDGNIAYSIITGVATSADGNYNGLNPSDVLLTNLDDDVASIVLSPIGGLTTTEAGGTATFSVVLTSQPMAAVSVGLASSNTAEGTISTATVIFTAANWSVAQTVTVTGVDDFVQDGNIAYSIITGVATSADGNYNGLNPSDVLLTNLDDDVASIVVSPIGGLTTTEAGGTATFSVVLTSQPTANVAIGLTSANAAEGTPSVASLVFTSTNWNIAQTVTVMGIDDFVQDGSFAYTILTAAASSVDGNYNGLNPSDVSLTNLDDDIASIVVSPIGGLTTTEAGGTATFSVVLTSQPTANVTIGLTSSNAAEGTPSLATLVFTSSNWNLAQTVTITGADDFVQDGNISYSIVTAPAASADANYNGENPSDVSLTNMDDDTAGISVTPISGLVTTESGGAATFNVVLTSQPTSSVTLTLVSTNVAEGTVSASSLTFTSANWNVAQIVTVTGVDDFLLDGNVAYGVVTFAATSADPNYNGLDPSDVSLTNQDNDTAGFTVTPISGLVTTEGGGSAAFSVVLIGPPTANVTISLTSSNPSEGTPSVSSLTFTPLNWNVAQTVTVTGLQDFVNDGSQAYSIVTGPAVSADLTYNGLNASDVALTNLEIANAPPAVAAPNAQLASSLDVVFSSANGNAITLGDADAGGNVLEITLSASQGTLSLSQNAGLSFLVGSGVADTTIVARGTLASLNAALDGLVFHTLGQSPNLILTIDDLGNTGTGGAMSATATIAITQVPLIPPVVNPPTTPPTSPPAVGPGPGSSSPPGNKSPMSVAPPIAAPVNLDHSLSRVWTLPTADVPPLMPVKKDAQPSHATWGEGPRELSLSPQDQRSLISVTVPSPRRSSFPDVEAIWNRLDLAANELESELVNNRYSIGVATGLGLGFSVGYALWLLRGSALAGSAWSSLPFWKSFDPLPVLEFNDRALLARRARAEESDTEARPLQELLAGR